MARADLQRNLDPGGRDQRLGSCAPIGIVPAKQLRRALRRRGRFRPILQLEIFGAGQGKGRLAPQLTLTRPAKRSLRGRIPIRGPQERIARVPRCRSRPSQ